MSRFAARVSEHPVLGESLKRFGTGGIVNTTNARNIIPTHNFILFQKGLFSRTHIVIKS